MKCSFQKPKTSSVSNQLMLLLFDWPAIYYSVLKKKFSPGHDVSNWPNLLLLLLKYEFYPRVGKNIGTEQYLMTCMSLPLFFQTDILEGSIELAANKNMLEQWNVVQFFSIRSLLHFDDFLVSKQAVGFFWFALWTTTISIAILALIFFQIQWWLNDLNLQFCLNWDTFKMYNFLWLKFLWFWLFQYYWTGWGLPAWSSTRLIPTTT